MWVAMVIGAVAAPLVTAEVVAEGSLRRRLADDDADLVLVVASEHRGTVGPCGCSVEPLGGLDRIDTYVQAMRRKHPETPVVALHAGGLWSVRPDEGLVEAAGTFAAILATPEDALGVRHASGLPWVEAPRQVRVGDLTVVVTGAEQAGEQRPEDLVVVLVFDQPKAVPGLVAIPGVDVVVEAGGYRGRFGPYADDDTVWVRTRDQGTVLGELRLWVDEGVVQRAVYRWVRLDARIR